MMTRFAHVYVLNVMSDDHPGIVAAVTTAVESLGGNIDACSQTVLGGFFTLIMIVSVPDPIDPGQLVERVCGANGDHFQVLARKAIAAERYAPLDRCERFVITAFGKDQPGIVRRFSQYLAGKDINIVDLYGDRKGDQEEFVLVGQVEVPSRWDIRMLQTDLEQMGEELGFAVKLQHENVFVATNQLRLAAMATG